MTITEGIGRTSLTNGVLVTAGRSGTARHPPRGAGLGTVIDTPSLLVETTADVELTTRADGSKVLVVGDLTGIRGASGELCPRPVAVAALGAATWRDNLAQLEGRFLIVDISSSGTCEIWADRFGQRDLYYQQVGSSVYLATRIDLLPVAERGASPDQMAFAHALTVYGFRPPKRHTFYEGVRRMGVDEYVYFDAGRFEARPRPFVPIPTRAYDETDLNAYADILLEAVRARASEAGNVVYLSSGWDSTAILGCLVHLFGNRSVRAVIGRMVYADRSGVINQFEIDRARKMAEFFDVDLKVVDFDYRRTAPEQIRHVQPILRAQQMAGITALNHWILADFAASTGRAGEAVFAGEMSDGAHNLGFSQYATYFHPTIEFREFFDKMAGYLHGPTFLKLLHDDKSQADPVYRLLRDRAAPAVFDEPVPTTAGRTQQMIASCLFRGVRVPLASLRNTRLLTEHGRDRFGVEIEDAYLEKAAREATPETLYAWYLHLYNSLHWQGSTVATIPVTAEANGLRCALPFHDARLQAFLSAMPETWGRALDLRPTKYPLKWMLANRIRYPMHLQAGPHSYLYDIDPAFNHSAEALYGSSMRKYFVDQLKRRVYEAWLSPDVFDLDYVASFVKRYVEGKEVRGSEMNDLWALCVLTMTGWYGAA